MNIQTRQLSFMALLTLILLVTVQAVSVYLLVADRIEARDYLGVWVPVMTLAVGYWFGKQGAA